MSDNQQGFEDQVRQRAYQLWEQEGRPEGRQDEFWYRARQEIQGAEDGSEPDDVVDFESEQSFPASDPPSFTSTRGPT
jgi:hypothetical protein